MSAIEINASPITGPIALPTKKNYAHRTELTKLRIMKKVSHEDVSITQTIVKPGEPITANISGHIQRTAVPVIWRITTISVRWQKHGVRHIKQSKSRLNKRGSKPIVTTTVRRFPVMLRHILSKSVRLSVPQEQSTGIKYVRITKHTRAVKMP